MVVDDAGLASVLAVGGSLVLALAAELFAAVDAGPAGHPALLAGGCAAWPHWSRWWGSWGPGRLVALLRQAYSDPAKRKSIGALWDVGTFWPRAVHPLAPPCYAERAVPEVVDRIRLLTGHVTTKPDDVAYLKALAGQPNLERTRRLTVPPGPLLLTGYSQGAVIAPAVIAQLPEDILPDVALLTLACPARRLYGRAFPAYLGRATAHRTRPTARRQGTRRVPRAWPASRAVEEPVPPQRLHRIVDLRRALPRSAMPYLHDHVDHPCRGPSSSSRTRTRARRPPTATPSSGPIRAPPRSAGTWSNCCLASRAGRGQQDGDGHPSPTDLAPGQAVEPPGGSAIVVQ